MLMMSLQGKKYKLAKPLGPASMLSTAKVRKFVASLIFRCLPLTTESYLQVNHTDHVCLSICPSVHLSICPSVNL
jgi:hypothetical protein